MRGSPRSSGPMAIDERYAAVADMSTTLTTRSAG
jgi:hypothetical protein